MINVSTTEFDGIVIGGAHNGLVCANYLASAGQKVLVLEATNIVGGGLRTIEGPEALSRETLQRRNLDRG